ncbi:MAG: NfeD family protein [Microthrixaceae bacterium]
MDAGDWGWIWLGAFVVFLVGELLTPGAFFLLGFAIGAIVAMLAAILGGSEIVQWALFLLVSGGAFAALRPLAHHMDKRADPSATVGATRLVGAAAVLNAPAGPGPDVVGMAEVGSEQWRAVTDGGVLLPAGTPVTVTRVEGTRVVVRAAQP